MWRELREAMLLTHLLHVRVLFLALLPSHSTTVPPLTPMFRHYGHDLEETGYQ